MAVTISSAEDAYLSGQAKFDEWKAKFEGDWYSPAAMTMVATLIGNMGQQERAMLEKMNPEAYALVAEMIGRQAKKAGGTNASRPR
jgi:hypothetical protein